jgi:ribosome-binding protein aMBF1 (putative translation factor)
VNAFTRLGKIRIKTRETDRAERTLDIMWRAFSLTVRKERRARGIRLEWFAKQLGYTRTMVSYLEAGQRRWPMEKAELAVKLLTRREEWPE